MINTKKGQIAIETAASIIAIFVFFLGVLQIFLWLNTVIVRRQQYYESSREAAGSNSPGTYSWQAPKLDVFTGTYSGSGGNPSDKCAACQGVYQQLCGIHPPPSPKTQDWIDACKNSMAYVGCEDCESLCEG